MLTVKRIERAIREAQAKGREVVLTDADDQRLGVSLTLRIRPGRKGASARWHVRYMLDGRRRVLALGGYPAMTLAGARKRAGELLRRYESGERDLHAVVEAEEDVRRAERRQREAERRRRTFTLGRLLDAYADDLERRGKGASAREVRGTWRRHLGALAQRPAAQLRQEEVVRLLGRIVDQGKRRTAGLLRSFIHAAYARVLAAAGDPTVHRELTEFLAAGVAYNPASGIAAGAMGAASRDRVLSQEEFFAFWDRLMSLKTAAAGAVAASVALGGQRPAQMVRVTLRDIADGVLLLRDPKGRRSEPRLHAVPLVGIGGEIVRSAAHRSEMLGWDLVFTSNGRVPLEVASLSRVVRRIARKMVRDGEAAGPFQMRDLRRTVETTLAMLGVSMDVRAQLLSHGLSGVQARHYDRHDYLEEKAAAILRLCEWIESRGQVARVIPLRRAGA